MKRGWPARELIMFGLAVAGTLGIGVAGCGAGADRGGKTKGQGPAASDDHAGSTGDGVASIPRPARPVLATLTAGEVYVYDDKTAAAARMPEGDARSGGRRVVVDLSDGWAPFIFQDGGGSMAPFVTGRGHGGGTNPDEPKPNAYRQIFIDLANDRIDADGRALDAARGEHNFLEPFGIPPTLSVLRARVEADLAAEGRGCAAQVDRAGLGAFNGNVGYLDREHARREYSEALRDADWLGGEIMRREGALTAVAAKPPTGAGGGGVRPRDAGQAVPPATWKPGDRGAAIAALRVDLNPKIKARTDRAVRGEARLRAVRAVQALLVCEGLLTARSRFTTGMFDLPTHEALAEWERKNDIFGWASLGGETLAALPRPALDLDFEAFKRILAERVADAAGIVEDGSTAKWKTPPTYQDNPASHDGAGRGDASSSAVDGGAAPGHDVPNVIDEHVSALLNGVHVRTPEDMVDFLRQHAEGGLATLRVAFVPPALPPYYGPRMELSVEIDRGDVWYDFPFDTRGHTVEQPRDHFPHLTLFVHWNGQKIPLCWWRTTIGSWRSELHANGKIYYKYKNSDVGPRVWKNIVAGPVWIPPDATPAKDLLIRKVLDRDKGPQLVVNTDVMGPGFQSAYGLVMAIHINTGGFDNQIRTHGSVDYTSIARRFSHGCHRLVNNRAVRLFDFVLRRQPFRRIGSIPLSIKRRLLVDERPYKFELKTRGYYYELEKPIPVNVTEGRIMGTAKAPITAYLRKVGVDYSGIDGKGETHAAGPTATTGPATPDSATGIRVPDAPDDPSTAIGP